MAGGVGRHYGVPMSSFSRSEDFGWDRPSLAPLDAALARIDLDRPALDPTVHAARRSLMLAQLAAFGFDDDPLSDDLVRDLADWGLDTLYGWEVAARARVAYQRSPERARRLGEAPLHVAVDLFRISQVPPVTNALLAMIEGSFVLVAPKGSGGTVFRSQGTLSLGIAWVREHGVARIYRWD